MQLARREQLPDPIPITWRSSDAPRSHEHSWQAAVVAELGLHDWVRMETGDELDWVGPVAARVVTRHGVVYPPNAHVHEPIAAEASGGSLLTGIGGDQLLTGWRWQHAADVLARRARPSGRDVLRVGLAHAPMPIRSRLGARRTAPVTASWLTPQAASDVARRIAAHAVAEPPTWHRKVAWQAARGDLQRGLAALDAIGAAHDCQVLHPLLDPTVVAAIGAGGRRVGFAGRDDALAGLFPTLRPMALAERRDKAVFDEVLSREPSLIAAREWQGEGVDPALVDVAALRAIWRERVPLRSALILQQFALQTPATHVAPR